MWTFDQHTGGNDESETTHDWTIYFNGTPVFYEGNTWESALSIMEAKELCALLNRVGFWLKV